MSKRRTERQLKKIAAKAAAKREAMARPGLQSRYAQRTGRPIAQPPSCPVCGLGYGGAMATHRLRCMCVERRAA